jgi:Tc5 transposase DNA-binding domain
VSTSATQNTTAAQILIISTTLPFNALFLHANMVSSYSEQEARIQKACSAYQKNPERPMTVLTQEFDVPYHALRRRLKGIPNKMEVGGQNKALSKQQEEALIDHIKLLENYEIPPRRGYLRGLANRILRHDHTDPTTPPHTIGINWA